MAARWSSAVDMEQERGGRAGNRAKEHDKRDRSKRFALRRRMLPSMQRDGDGRQLSAFKAVRRATIT